MTRRGIAAACLAAAEFAASAEPPRPVAFAVIGDMPYHALERPVVRTILREIDAHDVAFVIHVGDFKSGGSRCDDEAYHWNLELFGSSAHPLVYLPGDNEWTDCHRASAGGFDPLERLAFLRGVFHSGPESLGRRRITLERQSAHPRWREFVEHVRWSDRDVLFVGLNVPGSNNNSGRSVASEAEFRARSRAVAAWLDDAFALARGPQYRALVIAMHGDPHFDARGQGRAASGYRALLAQLESGVTGLGKPVLLVHGDSHTQRTDRPLVPAATGGPVAALTRVETYGSPWLGWVKVSVDPGSAEPFRVETFRYGSRGTNRASD